MSDGIEYVRARVRGVDRASAERAFLKRFPGWRIQDVWANGALRDRWMIVGAPPRRPKKKPTKKVSRHV